MTLLLPPASFPGARPLALVLLSACLFLPFDAHARPLGAQGDDFLYQVEPGDTLEQLARRYTLRAEHWPALQRLNQVDDPYRLPIGKVLRIPLSLIPERPATATVIHVVGSVMADGRAVKPGDVLRAGQSLRSAGDGAATLRLEDQSLLTLPPGTTLRIRHLQAFQGPGLTGKRNRPRSGWTSIPSPSPSASTPSRPAGARSSCGCGTTSTSTTARTW